MSTMRGTDWMYLVRVADETHHNLILYLFKALLFSRAKYAHWRMDPNVSMRCEKCKYQFSVDTMWLRQLSRTLLCADTNEREAIRIKYVFKSVHAVLYIDKILY